jgi:hypothetical protein
MPYIDDEGNYPLYPADIWVKFPNWKLDSDAPKGFFEFAVTEAPELKENQKLVPQAPVLLEGNYTQSFAAVDLTAEEIAQTVEAEAAKLALFLAEGFTREEIESTGMMN